LGDSIAAANGQSSGRYTSDDPLGGLIALNGGWSGVSTNLPQSVGSFSPDMSASTADQLLADLGSGGRSYGGGNLYADASSAMRTGIVSDAGGGGSESYRVEIGGMGWAPSKTVPSLSDGTPVMSSTDPGDSRLQVELPAGADVPSIPGYTLQGSKTYSSLGTTSHFYTPGTPSDGNGIGLGSDFLNDWANAAEAATPNYANETARLGNYPAPGFNAELVDQQILNGTYNSFSAIGGALGNWQLGDARRYATYTPSEQARAAAVARVYPQPSAEAQRLSTMMASPGGAIAWGVSGLAGASPRTQDGILQTVAALGQVAGAGTNVYKQTPTAPAPTPYGAAARPRGVGNVPPAPTGGNNPATSAAAARGSTLHSDKPGHLPDQLRALYPNIVFEFTKPGIAGQDVRVLNGQHPSGYPGSTWPKGVDYADFKPGTSSGARTFDRDQRLKWSQPTYMLPYDPATRKLK